MLRYLSLLNVTFLVVYAAAAWAQPDVMAQKNTAVQPVVAKPILPKRIQLSYDVTRNTKPFAVVHEQFLITDKTYRVESITKGIGVYSLLGERKLSSIGELTAQGLKPNHFELHQGDNSKKSLMADFDWPNKILHMLVKGKVNDVDLAPGTQDLASYAYQFMFLSDQLKDVFSVKLTTGKRLNQYTYKINAGQEVLALPVAEGVVNEYKTIHLQLDSVKPQAESKELWLAAEYYYLPVRIMMMDENGAKIEQTLTELHVE